MNNSLKRWLQSKYAVNWHVAIAMFLNYPITGYFFGETITASNGFTNHTLDLLTGFSCALLILCLGVIRKYYFKDSLTFVLVSYFFVALTVIPFVNNIRNSSGFSSDPIELLVSGIFQMFGIQVLFTVIISSLLETRYERIFLQRQLSSLTFSRSTFEEQILEINLRLKKVVNEKLNILLDDLQNVLGNNKNISASELAEAISETLNEGVRPLSWDIENESTQFEVKQNTTIKRVGLLERISYPIRFKQVIDIRVLMALYLFFDVPVMYFYFDAVAAIETIGVIAFTGLMLWGVKEFFGDRIAPSWFAIFINSSTVAIAGSSFILVRAIAGELSADLAEIALVISMTQIAIFGGIFLSSLVRRYAYLQSQRQVNRELESLVSQLRQSAWVAKRKLARLVHGQVQSDLLAAYLQLKHAPALNAAIVEQVGQRIQKAKAALSQTDDSSPDFQHTLEQITATWGSSFKVNTHIAPDALAALQKDPVATSCALEVLMEGINNAAKYGTAGQAALVIRLTPDSNLYIEVTNQTDVSEAANAGFGSTILDEVTHEWDFGVANGVAKLSAEVILNLDKG
jgi:signal transduction histidine kinase